MLKRSPVDTFVPARGHMGVLLYGTILRCASKRAVRRGGGVVACVQYLFCLLSKRASAATGPGVKLDASKAAVDV